MKPYYERNGITIYHADCRAVLPTLAKGSVDTVIVDSPYNAPPESKKGGTTVRLKRWLREDGFTYYDNDALLTDKEFHEFFAIILEGLSHVAMPGNHLYWFTTRYNLHRFEVYLSDPLYHFTLRNLLVWKRKR